jgi:hypothetical protein
MMTRSCGFDSRLRSPHKAERYDRTPPSNGVNGNISPGQGRVGAVAVHVVGC